MPHPCFPFSAVIGQDKLKTALILCAIDPKIGGVVVAGPRGCAKTTLARGLTDICSGRFVTLPLGASEEQLTGSLDLNKALQEAKLEFSPGLLAKAHHGILYLDEVNLLQDHLVDLLLDVSASGQNYIERDGISHQHPAQFILIGTMNPDEGELRPQLLDRFGFYIALSHQFSARDRVEIVNQRLDFDQHPTQFIEKYQPQQDQLIGRLKQAQALLPEIQLAQAQQLAIAERCQAEGVDGFRADITLRRAALAYAAWQQKKQVDQSDTDAVAEFVLAHRRNNNPQKNQDNTLSSPPQQPEHQQQQQSGNQGAMPPMDAVTGTKRKFSGEDLKKKYPPTP